MQSLIAVNVKQIFRGGLPNHDSVLILGQSWSIMCLHELQVKNRQRGVKITPTYRELSRALHEGRNLRITLQQR